MVELVPRHFEVVYEVEADLWVVVDAGTPGTRRCLLCQVMNWLSNLTPVRQSTVLDLVSVSTSIRLAVVLRQAHHIIIGAVLARLGFVGELGGARHVELLVLRHVVLLGVIREVLLDEGSDGRRLIQLARDVGVVPLVEVVRVLDRGHHLGVLGGCGPRRHLQRVDLCCVQRGLLVARRLVARQLVLYHAHVCRLVGLI